MLAIVNRDNGTLVSVRDFHDAVSDDARTFYYVGKIDGILENTYAVDFNVALQEIVHRLPDTLPKICGNYAGLSTRDGIFEFASSDISALEELYYVTTPFELILSTDFFELAKARGQLEFDECEVRHFLKTLRCRKGRTTFKGVFRLPPGYALGLDRVNGAVTFNYLSGFRGGAVTYEVFKNTLVNSIASTIHNEPSFSEVVACSGGVDSLVLLALINRMKDVRAVTFRIIPALAFNERDVVTSVRDAQRLEVPHEFVDVDLNEINLDHLDDVILSMPFAAHPVFFYKKMFQALRVDKTRVWTGQDADTLYCYDVAFEPSLIHRFMLSAAYARMLPGVDGHERYRFFKMALDVPLKWLVSRMYKRHFETPRSFDELVEYYIEAERIYLPMKALGQETCRVERVPTSSDIPVRGIRAKLFDELALYLQGGPGHKIQLQAQKLYNVEIKFAYSTAGMIHLFRNLNLSSIDVLFAKRYLYRYARELGVPKSYTLTPPGPWQRTVRLTYFGTELEKKAMEAATQVGLTLDTSDRNIVRTELALLWINNVRDELIRTGVTAGWPKFT